ncbi:MAG: LCP family protein [Anaerolineaceae bacterium]|nr:LCP family protein [Anaerolineaceae bacterium]
MNRKSRKLTGRQKLWISFGVIGLVTISVFLIYIFWFKPTIQKPLSDALTLPTQQADNTNIGQLPSDETEGSMLSNVSSVPIYTNPTTEPGKKPICGNESEWLVLLVGVDYMGDGYLYGLADVIRVARIDFVNAKINLVALPRDLIVDIPENRLIVEGPIKINQAYLFGTAGMGHYVGSGLGAGSLAEVIQYNFGVSVDHYGVINFNTFTNFVDVIGGIEVDLPYYVDDRPHSFFPAGKQTLSGTQALALARIRQKYSDGFRINNQTLILKAIFNRLMQPEILIKLPGLVDRFKDSVLTDLSIDQIGTAVCFIRKFGFENLNSFSVPEDFIIAERAYIPTLNNESFVYNWDERLITWFHESLRGSD